MDKRFGTLYGVSAGPGDPELITLKALKILESCPVLAAPVTHRGNSLALDIVRKLMDISGKELLMLPFKMTSGEAELEACHEPLAGRVAEKLRAGKDVAFACLGDVSVFSTFSYIGKMLEGRGFSVEMVPGVTSFCASACALGTSLTDKSSPLHIIPAASVDAADALRLSGTKVFMKPGGSFPELLGDISGSGQAACAAINCGMDGERLFKTLENMPDEPGYFATVIVKEKP